MFLEHLVFVRENILLQSLSVLESGSADLPTRLQRYWYSGCTIFLGVNESVLTSFNIKRKN
jgi:hypothetical protein